MGTVVKHPVPDGVKPSFVIFDIRALWRSGLSIGVPGCATYLIFFRTYLFVYGIDCSRGRGLYFNLIPNVYLLTVTAFWLVRDICARLFLFAAVVLNSPLGHAHLNCKKSCMWSKNATLWTLPEWKITKIAATRCQILRQKCTNSISAGAPPHIPLWELTALPQTPTPLAGFKGSYF